MTVALALLAIPPILTNAYVGVRQVEPRRRSTPRAAMGMTGVADRPPVELPLALPLIFGGITTSTVNVIATATIAPLVGVLTLGDPIITGTVYGAPGSSAPRSWSPRSPSPPRSACRGVQRAVTPAGLKLERGGASRPGTLKRRIQTVP